MWIEETDPDTVMRNVGRGTALVPRQAITEDPSKASADYGFGDAFGAAFLRENTLVSTIHEMFDGDTKTAQDLIEGKNDFNPYRYLGRTLSPEVLAKIAPAINEGEFEGAVSERMAQAIVDDILYELDLQAKMEASGWGSFWGSAVAAVVDPTSYIPFVGVARKTGRIATFSLNAALSTGVSEMALQATQRSRTIQETLMNVGTSGLIGGGLGIFAAGLGKSSTLNPSNPNNPLRRENLDRTGLIVRTPDNALQDEITPEELAELREMAEVGERVDSIGAARVSGTEQVTARVARTDPKTALGRVKRTVGDFLNSKTIVGRVVRATSDTARMIGLRLMDPGAILLDLNLRGKALRPSAEALKSDYMAEVDQLYAKLFQNTAKLNLDLGRAHWYSRGKVAHQDVLKSTQRALFRMDDPEWDSTLVDRYGTEVADRIKQTASESAEEIHRLNDTWEKRLIDEGLLQDEALLSKLEADYETAKQAIKDNAADPEGTLDHQDITRLRQIRDQARERLQAERRKSKPLGRDYGHAQLWNREAILENPEEFKAFLLDALAIRPDKEWLDEVYELSPDGLEALRIDDPAKFSEVLTNWAGDEYYWRISRIEAELKANERALKEAELDLAETMRASGHYRREETRLALSEARKRRDALHTATQAARARREQLQTEHRAFKEASTAARGQTLDAQLREGQTPLEELRDMRVRGAVRADQKMDTVIEDALTDPATPVSADGVTRAFDAGDVVQSISKAADANVRVARAETAVRQDIDSVGLQTARQQGRALEVADELARVDRRVKILETRQAQADASLARVEQLHADATALRKQLKDSVQWAKENRGISEDSVAKVKRALRKAKGRTPLEEMVDEIYRKLSTTGKLPAAIMDRIGEESDRVTGRVRERTINLDNTSRTLAIQKGWLKDDLSEILYAQYEQLSAELAIREALSIGPTRQFQSWQQVTESVREDYNQMIADATEKAIKDKLRKERDILVDDLVEARDRLKGLVVDTDGTTDGWARWLSAKFRHLNFIRFGSGFLASSLTDTAAIALRHGSITRLLAKHGKQVIEEMRRAWHDNPSELENFISATEIAQGASAAMRRYGTDDLVHGAYANYGIGFGRTRKITGAIDKGAEDISRVVATWSGLPAWNRFWKTVSGIAMSHKLRDMTGRYDALTAAEKADLASLGVGRSEALEIAKYVEKYGETVDGRFDPHLERWGETNEAAEAARNFRIAITRDMNRAIATPGIGDTPRLMSKWWGRLWLQFQTFAFTMMNRYFYPLAQRRALFNERRAYQSMALLMTSAMFSLLAADLRNGRDPTERLKPENMQQTLHDIIDRSGFLGWTSPYVDSALKLTSGITGYGGSTRNISRSWVEPMFGVSAGLVGDTQRAGAALATADPDVVKKLLVLAPFSAQARLFWNQLIQPSD